MKNILLFAFLCLQTSLFAQWKAFTPALKDTVGSFDLRIAQGNNQVAWCVAMKYNISASAYEWVAMDSLVFAKTADGGDTWTGGTIPMGPEPYASNICPISNEVAWASGVDANFTSYVVHTADGGKTWARQLADGFSESSSYIDFVHFWDTQHGLAVGDPAPSATDPAPFYEIYTTSDGGQTWARIPTADIPPPLANEFGSAGQYQVRGDYVWFLTIDVSTFATKRLFRSKNRGKTWEVLSDADDRFVFFNFADTLHGIGAKRISATEVGIIYTEDGGDTWVDLPNLQVAGPGAAWTLVPESNYILTVRRTSNIAGPFRTLLSKDLGQTWMEISSGTGENVGNAAFDSPTVGYGGELQPADHPTRMYKYAGDPLTGLLQAKQLDAEFSVLPNPSADFISANVKSSQKTDFLLLLNDSQGRLIERIRVPEGSNFSKTFDLRGLPAGVYNLTLSSSAGHLTRSFVKNAH
ncbi:MAG: hypothetical protein ACK4Q5_19195 [Saprospiraceae bacterium]